MLSPSNFLTTACSRSGLLIFLAVKVKRMLDNVGAFSLVKFLTHSTAIGAMTVWKL